MAQPWSHRDVGDTCYEFHALYRPDGALDQGGSFWLVLPLDQGDAPEPRWLTYAEHRAELGRKARSFAGFARWNQPPEIIEGWLAHITRDARRSRWTVLRGEPVAQGA